MITALEVLDAGGSRERPRASEDVGIHGNGHMMMLEKNNPEIAAYMDGWLRASSWRHIRKSTDEGEQGCDVKGRQPVAA
jgi:hypothetical protein